MRPGAGWYPHLVSPPVPSTIPDEATITTVAQLVGDKWSMLVVRDVFRGVRRFDDLCQDLGVARAVLAG